MVLMAFTDGRQKHAVEEKLEEMVFQLPPRWPGRTGEGASPVPSRKHPPSDSPSATPSIWLVQCAHGLCVLFVVQTAVLTLRPPMVVCLAGDGVRMPLPLGMVLKDRTWCSDKV
jgi:hypothetical protein